MALPWLIGGAIALGVAAAAASKKDNDYDDYDDFDPNEEEERRRRREAERRRAEEAKRLKKEALEIEIMNTGNEQADVFKDLLYESIELTYDTSKPFKDLDHNLSSLDSSFNELVSSLNSLDESIATVTISAIENLEIIPTNTLKNLSELTKLYDVDEMEPKEALIKIAKETQKRQELLMINEDLLSQLNEYKNNLR